MIPEIDIYRTAKLLVDRHGQDAPIHAAMRADELLAAGDMAGKAAWVKILKATEELLGKSPAVRQSVH